MFGVCRQLVARFCSHDRNALAPVLWLVWHRTWTKRKMWQWWYFCNVRYCTLCALYGVVAMLLARQTVWLRWLRWSMTSSRSSKVWWQQFMHSQRHRRRLMVRRRRTGAVDVRLLPTSFRHQLERPKQLEKLSRSWMASWLEWHSVSQCQTCQSLIWPAALRNRLAVLHFELNSLIVCLFTRFILLSVVYHPFIPSTAKIKFLLIG